MAKFSNLFKLEKYKDAQPHHHHISLLIVGEILLIITLIILIKPAFTGFSISDRFEKLNITPADAIEKQEKLNLEINALQSKLGSCNEDEKELKEQIASESDDRASCLKEKGGLEAELYKSKKDFKRQLDSNLKKIEAEKLEIAEQMKKENEKSDELEKSFNELAQNSAKNICCKSKVDDKAIDSYKIADNKVICGKGEANTISC